MASRNACSRIETVTLSHLKRSVPAPSWMQAHAERIARDAGLFMLMPVVRAVTVDCETTFGGRWFPRLNSICVILHRSRRLTYGVTNHEMGHWMEWARHGDEPGEHESDFLTTVAALYEKYGVSTATAREIEQRYPPSWNAPTWDAVRRRSPPRLVK